MTETRISNGHVPMDEQSLGALVATASRDLSELIHKEIELAKMELATSAKRAGLGAGLLTGSGVFVLFGFLFGSVAAAFGIHALGLGLGWSFLVVAGGFLLIAGAMVAVGIGSLRAIRPPSRTIVTVKDDIAWARHPTRDPAEEN